MTGFCISFDFLRRSAQEGSNADSFVVNFALALCKGFRRFGWWFLAENCPVFSDLRKQPLDTRHSKGLY
jgi:hypothetical protein